MDADPRSDVGGAPEPVAAREGMSQMARARLKEAMAHRADDPQFQHRLDRARDELARMAER